ncbi:DUF2071 domain-containing protein [Flavobacterium sp. '19STA2R22 D10 B1']|uniref:DUF2071 domain-containing protein n=1 Tax=Flavobacterium aerium TaxID=3037261 RepID=UPI00278BC481|nr:DUF2071 domain-containing protein [Flavobacterium sp. '19STA2R22 D10 B1']
MLPFLKNHPFSVEAFFENTYVLTFAVPKEELQGHIPECLELDTFNDQWAFITLALVQTKGLRPKGFPAILGDDFFLIGYRIFVKYINTKGKRLRGLYILKSETNNKKMEVLGNIFTHYNYTTTDITEIKGVERNEISSNQSNFKVVFQNCNEHEESLPEHSPFSKWKDARRFSGPLPFTFTYDETTHKVLIIEGVREDWNPRPIKIIDYEVSFFEKFSFTTIQLASSFVIKDIPYYWKKGKIEEWKQ